MELNKVASTIINDLWGGNLIPLSNRSLLSIEQVEDECIAERELIIKEWYLTGQLSKNDVAVAVNCIAVDCADPNKCPCETLPGSQTMQHFEIPALVGGLGRDSIVYVGSTDRTVPFRFYYNLNSIKYQKYRKRDSKRPYVYIERTPNVNGMYDGWIFNAPLVKHIAVIGVFKDPRQLVQYNCCDTTDYLDLGPVSSEIIRRILAKKSSLYRTASIPATQITS